MLPSPSAPLVRALRCLVVLAAIAATSIGVTTASLPLPYLPVLVAYPAIGLANIVAGAWLWQRRPSNRLGLLLVVFGLLVVCAAAGNTPSPTLILVGVLLGEAPIAALFHLMLAFPSGQVAVRARVLVLAGYLVTVGLQVPQYLYATAAPAELVGWIHIRPDAGVVSAFDDAQRWVGLTVLACGGVLVARRIAVAATAAQRRALVVVDGFLLLAILWFPFTANVVGPWLDLNVFQLFGTQIAPLAAVPLVVAVAVMAGGFAKTLEVAELGRWLASDDAAVSSPREALAAALGDPSLEVHYRLPGAREVVDDGGRPVAAGVAGGPRRGVVQVRRGEDAPAISVVYDRTLIADPQVPAEAARVMAIALERDALSAALLARTRELADAARTLGTLASTERRRVARDLHDSVQNRLVLASLAAGRLDTTPDSDPAVREVREHLNRAIEDLRRVVDDVMPSLLLERGLVAALEEVLDRMPLPSRLTVAADLPEPPEPVATALYFLTTEALTNVVKHARATSLEVELAASGELLRLSVRDDGVGATTLQGGGVRGMVSRVVPLGGRVEFDSAPGAGTVVRVEVPCAS